MCRKGFPEVQAVTYHVMRAMRKAKGAPIPLEKAALCVTLDVIGRVGFQKDFGATSSFEAAIEGKALPPTGEDSEGSHTAHGHRCWEKGRRCGMPRALPVVQTGMQAAF